MDYFQQQDGHTHCFGLQAEQTVDLKICRRRQQCPYCPPLALVHNTSIARTGIQLVSVHLRPILIIQEEREE